MIQCYGASQILRFLERLNAKSAEELAAALPAGLKRTALGKCRGQMIQQTRY